MTSLHSGPSEPSAKPVLIEACVDSVASAQAAQAGGAGRLELCVNLNDGGTTPSAGMIEAVLAQVQIPTFVIIRPRGGGFIYSTSELDVMRREILWARRLGAHGIVSGTLATDGRVQRAQLTALLESAGDLPFTFHRAFDLTPDLGEALEHLIEAGVVRVLTSGGAQTALDGADRIAQLVQQAGARNTVLAGGGINEDNVQEIVRHSGVTEVHVRGTRVTGAGSAAARAQVKLRRPLLEREDAWEETDEKRIRALVQRVTVAVPR